MAKELGLKIERRYVNRDALLRGERIEKDESEFTPRELEEIHKKQIDWMMNSLGYVREDAI